MAHFLIPKRLIACHCDSARLLPQCRYEHSHSGSHSCERCVIRIYHLTSVDSPEVRSTSRWDHFLSGLTAWIALHLVTHYPARPPEPRGPISLNVGPLQKRYHKSACQCDQDHTGAFDPPADGPFGWHETWSLWPAFDCFTLELWSLGLQPPGFSGIKNSEGTATMTIHKPYPVQAYPRAVSPLCYSGLVWVENAAYSASPYRSLQPFRHPLLHPPSRGQVRILTARPLRQCNQTAWIWCFPR